MGADGQRIVNLFTQEPPKATGGHPGRATAQHVGHSLRELHALVEAEKIKSLALPRLATGVGGLAWSVVRPLLEQHLGKLKIPVLVYTRYEKGVVAKEPPLG